MLTKIDFIEILRKEKTQKETLTKLSEEYIKEKKHYEKDFNTNTIIKEIANIRILKIIDMAIMKTKTQAIDDSNMTLSEQTLYQEIQDAIIKNRNTNELYQYTTKSE